MNTEKRFTLETAIATWRRFLRSERSISADDADELESHLRDEVEALLAEGLDAKTADQRQLFFPFGDNYFSRSLL